MTQLRRWHSWAWSAVLRSKSMPFLVLPVRLERRRNKYKELPSHLVPVCPALYTWRQCSCAQHVIHVTRLLSWGGLQGSAHSQWGWDPRHRGAHQGGRVEMTLDAIHSIFVPLRVFLLTDTRVTLPPGHSLWLGGLLGLHIQWPAAPSSWCLVGQPFTTGWLRGEPPEPSPLPADGSNSEASWTLQGSYGIRLRMGLSLRSHACLASPFPCSASLCPYWFLLGAHS